MLLLSFSMFMALIMAIVASNLIEADTDTDSEYCCSFTKATTRWMQNCQTFDEEASCTADDNECKWMECDLVGYCEWSGKGEDGNLASQKCDKQATRQKCVNFIYAGSGACTWVFGYPPQQYIEQAPDDYDEEEEEEKEVEQYALALVEADTDTEEYCCSFKVATTKWMNKCPDYGDESSCTADDNKCKWMDCDLLGYCEWSGKGEEGNLASLRCDKQATRQQCVNFIYAGSGACTWIFGSPPQQYIEQAAKEEEEEQNALALVEADTDTEEYCCSFKMATTKWMNKCPDYEDESSCTADDNKCKWMECDLLGYCEWSGKGEDGNLASQRCDKQATRQQCVNFIYAGSGACTWVFGYPPQQHIETLAAKEQQESVFMVYDNLLSFYANQDNMYLLRIIMVAIILIFIIYCIYQKLKVLPKAHRQNEITPLLYDTQV